MFAELIALASLDKKTWHKGKKDGTEFKTYKLTDNVVQKFITKQFNIEPTEGGLEFAKNEDFQKLPLWLPEISINYYKIDDAVWDKLTNVPEKDIYVNAYYDTELSAQIYSPWEEVPEAKLFTETIFNFDIFFKSSKLNNLEGVSIFFKEGYGVASHELTHAYQDYQEGLSTGKVTGKDWRYGKENALNWIDSNMKNISKSKDWEEFTNLVYLHLSFEINARVSELYHRAAAEGITDRKDFIEFMKKSDVYKQANMLLNFDAEDFVKNFKSPIHDVMPLADRIGMESSYDEENSFFKNLLSTYGDFGKFVLYFSNPIRYWKKLKLMASSKDTKSKHMMKEFINYWSVLVDSFEPSFSQHYEHVPKMEPVPQAAKEDPMVFFKFWEKRFHERGEDFKRRVHKLVAHYEKRDPLANKLQKEEKYSDIFKGLESDESDETGLGWIKEIPDQSEEYKRSLALLEEIFKDTDFEVKYNSRVSYTQLGDVWKNGEQYSSFKLREYPINWLRTAGKDYNQAEVICGKDCDLTLVQKEIYNTIANYINNNGLGAIPYGSMRPKQYKLIES